MKGIILAGGKGTRLQPATFAMNKHMVPILNKPMILYPIDTLKALGIRDILIVSGGNHIGAFADFLGDGSELGVSLTYRVQKDAGGIAQALGMAEDFANGERVAVILGDNIFDNDYLEQNFDEQIHTNQDHAQLFVKSVKNPTRFGVLSFEDGVYAIEEKPVHPKSDKAVTGLYIYPSDVFGIVKTLVPSGRGELEITDVNNAYILMGKCVGNDLDDSFWSDAGTPESLWEVTNWVYNKK